MAGLLLTDLLLVVGGLPPSHALPEGTGSHRKGLLSPEPMAAVWAGSCHVRPCGWEMLWMLFCTEIKNNPVFPPLQTSPLIN